MATFQIVDPDTVTAQGAFGTEYTVTRMPLPRGGFLYAVNAMVKAYNRGFATGRDFGTIGEIERAYKGLRGISDAFGFEAGI